MQYSTLLNSIVQHIIVCFTTSSTTQHSEVDSRCALRAAALLLNLPYPFISLSCVMALHSALLCTDTWSGLDPQHHSYFVRNFNFSFNYPAMRLFDVINYNLRSVLFFFFLSSPSLWLLHNRSSFSAARDASVSTELYLRPPKKREGNICNRLIEYIFSY